MKKILPLLLLIGMHSAKAQFPVDTLFKNGPINKNINLVFLGDGYQTSELDKYILDTKRIVDDIFSISPFKEYKTYFNAFAIKVPSTQSGVKHPQSSQDPDCSPVPVMEPTTYFGSTLDAYGIHRLLVPARNVASALASSFPQYDQAFLVANSEYYGGSGGAVATASTNESGVEISIHEIGHSFALLADEYWAGEVYAAEKPNMTKQSNPTLVKWKNWIGLGGISIYGHEEAPTWYRPHQECKMRYLGYPFCNVCVETFTERIHTLVNPLLQHTPEQKNLEVSGEPIEFSVSLLKPQPNTLKVIWKNNGAIIAKNTESLSIPVQQFMVPLHTIKAEITDTTLLSKTDTHLASHVTVVEWKVHQELTTGLEVTSSTVRYKVETSPNPFTESITVKYELPRKTRVTISVVSTTGQVLKKLVAENQQAGQHAFTFSSADLNTRMSGQYFLNLDLDSTSIPIRIIKQ